MIRRLLFALTLMIGMLLAIGLAQAWRLQLEAHQIYLPIVEKPPPTPTPTPTISPPPPPVMVEFRGLWVSRFDWITTYGQASPEKIDEIVNNAAYAGFNAIIFQVRGEADAYYTPGPEPWARRLTGALGQNPGWDPLSRMIEKAHQAGIQVHAYINVYPVWGGCTPPPDGTTPRHLYYRLRDHHGITDNRLNGLQWTTKGAVPCSEYQWGTPASIFLDNEMLAVTAHLINNYSLDGVHLDRIRYASNTTSCDPVSAAASGVTCFDTPPNYASYSDWQRAQVNGTVWKFYNQIVPIQPAIGLSAAVWPSYSAGFNNYFQDPKAWLYYGYIDMVMPMLYPSSFACPDNSWLTKQVWTNTVIEYQQVRNGRQIIPGIGAGYCTFDEIADRIAIGRQLGTAGHAIFAYRGLLHNEYFTALRDGPYAVPAVPPPISR
jgi:uncharacterized lipoprotein YddW (UPF0748 family)